MTFLEVVSGIAFDNKTINVQFASCLSVESIYHLRNFNIAYPYSFLKKLLQSLMISESKTVTTVNGKLHPSGSYPVMQR